ncbi:MAG: metalloregulator ArsR/SmtB family transcription factor [Desulfuromonadaceae bacterium]|nr:metalloregulator ArsR/SmtB family transcription factor [Desulfuromonadaceae bacterium]
MVKLFKSLADVTRLRLVAILAQGEFTVSELTDILAMGQSRISRHLKILLDAGIVTVQRQGTWSYFRLDGKNNYFQQLCPTILEYLATDGVHPADQQGITRILDERQRKSRDFFDHHAREWDRLAKEMIVADRYQGVLLEQLGQVETVVDVGVGTGSLLGDLSLRARQVIGIDHSPSMLNEARTRVENNQLVNVDLRLGEMTHLPVADHSADALILNMVLHHAPQPPTVFNELRRVLRPGGRVLIAELERHQLEWFRDRLADQWLGFTRQELTDWLQLAGYRLVSLKLMKNSNKLPAVQVLTAELIDQEEHN